MHSNAWVQLLQQIPPQLREQLMIVTAAGIEISVNSIMRIDHEFVAFKGRLSGSQDQGRLFFLPFRNIDYVGFQREVKDEQYQELFGNLQVSPPPQLAVSLAAQAETPKPEPVQPQPEQAEVPPPAPEPEPELLPQAESPPVAPSASLPQRSQATIKSAILERLPLPLWARNELPAQRGGIGSEENGCYIASMATTQSIPSTRKSAPIGSIQPGGGLCLSLELLWGRCRRTWLRTFFPGYVKRMAGLRQGDCPGCPHDIIDSRDLKPWRNVCGYWFRPEDDRHAWRGRLRLAGLAWPSLFCFSLLFLAISLGLVALGLFVHPACYAGLAVVVLLWGFIFSFFRDPERAIPADPAALVSPADGTITHVEEVDDPDFPTGRALRVSIFLSVFNVHVNRVPRTGRVTGLHYYPGSFRDARAQDCHACNEQFWVDMVDQATGPPLRIKQIAGAIARRIVCWLKPDEEVRKGERFGMIKFGSRTDVLLPAAAVAEVLVQVGDKVKGGSTVLLRMR